MAEYRSIEPLQVDNVTVLTVGTTAQDVAVNGKAFLIQNLSGSNTVYIKEKKGVACTATNGISIGTSTTFPFQLVMDTMSIIASGATTKVVIAYLS